MTGRNATTAPGLRLMRKGAGSGEHEEHGSNLRQGVEREWQEE